MEKKTILIVDDMEINRVILAEGFKDNYHILEAKDGRQAIDIISSRNDITVVLLDLIMPEVDGIEVLRYMNKTDLITKIPVFIITAANSETLIQDAYNLGAVDVIYKPFMINFIKCRVGNVVELYRQRNELEKIVEEKLERLDQINRSMVEALASIIEFRDCESGEHVKRISSLTKTLMTKISEMYPEYYMPKEEIDKIASASVLHDVGKISIPDSILNKPGKLTAEEFEIMKLHTVKGCELLGSIKDIIDDDIYRYGYDICRHHHEKWDGKGYPDGLAGENISIWAQVVSVADVYDALISPRVYKSAFTHETAVNMIHNGECGQFNPKVLAAFDASVGKMKVD